MGATLSLYTDYVFFVPVKFLHVWKIGSDLAFTLALPASEAVGKENLCSQLPTATGNCLLSPKGI